MARASLDQLSTSQTTFDLSTKSSPKKCTYGAPYFAFSIHDNTYGVVQGNCHHWDCPRCGIGRAKHEYGRIVEGCKTIAQKHEIYFITITTRGKSLRVSEAEDKYLEWTNRLLTNCRTYAKRKDQTWIYCQVTERQKRRHPHSHILTTFHPLDLFEGHIEKWETDKNGSRRKHDVPALRSNWLQRAVISSGLGEQYDISVVEQPEAASRYVAKYLFKSGIFRGDWPPGWRRIRYSQSFPKLPDKTGDAFILLSAHDWFDLAACADSVRVTEETAISTVTQALAPYPTKIVIKIDNIIKNDYNR